MHTNGRKLICKGRITLKVQIEGKYYATKTDNYPLAGRLAVVLANAPAVGQRGVARHPRVRDLTEDVAVAAHNLDVLGGVEAGLEHVVERRLTTSGIYHRLINN